jgi:hypothetical protein
MRSISRCVYLVGNLGAKCCNTENAGGGVPTKFVALLQLQASSERDDDFSECLPVLVDCQCLLKILKHKERENLAIKVLRAPYRTVLT